MRNEIILPGLHQGQQTVIKESSRYNWLMAGRRWRKTSLAVVRSIEGALQGLRVIWGAPTYKQMAIGWNETLKCLKYANDVVRIRKSENKIYFPNGWIQFFTLDDPETIRGYPADRVILDEVSDIQEQAWTSIIRPMLIDTGGDAWFIGTPKGRNWVWRHYERARQRIRDGEETNSRVWSIPTVGLKVVDGTLLRETNPLENPDIDVSEMFEWYHGTTEREFRQEALAEFIEGEGAVFRRIFDNCEGVLRGTKNADGTGGPYSGEFALGVDWGRVNDYTALVLIDKWRRRVVDFQRFNHTGFELQKNLLMGMVDKWNRVGGSVTILAEQNSFGRPLIEALSAPPFSLSITAFDTNGTSKNPLIEELQLDIERGKIKYPRVDVILSELEAYEQVTMPSGRVSYGAPDGLNDDTVIALALANRESKNQILPNEPFEIVTEPRRTGVSVLTERERKMVDAQVRQERGRLGL